jgi:hypothetical protein
MASMIVKTSQLARPGLTLWVRVLALLVCLVCGCENPNEAFNGRWGPPEIGDEEESSIDLGLGEMWPQLHLGHYGLEVAGVVTFHTSNLVTGKVSECTCSFVQHHHLNLDAGSLVFTTNCGSATADWALEITRNEDDQVFLEGEVVRTDDPLDIQEIRLERSVVFVDPFDPFCGEPES